MIGARDKNQAKKDGFRKKREHLVDRNRKGGKVGINTSWSVGLVWELKRVTN